eukprot:736449-Ditylum_brightwellii.AAC.1
MASVFSLALAEVTFGSSPSPAIGSSLFGYVAFISVLVDMSPIAERTLPSSSLVVLMLKPTP